MKSLYTLAAAAASLAAAPAAAQEADEPTDIIVTAIGVEQDAETNGQAVTVIDRDTIERRQIVAVSDLLATTPGVTVTRNGGLGTLTGVRIRGAESDQTLVLIDGVRVNDLSSPGGGFDFANLLSHSVERIEVLRGPNSVPWGGQAIGGVVNVLTHRPTEGLQARGQVEYGDMNLLFAAGGISGGSGIFSGSLSAGYLATDGISAFAGGTEPDGYRQYGASGRVEIAFTPDIRLDLRGTFADSRTDIDGFPAPAFALADTSEYSTAEELYGHAGLHADLGRLRNMLAFQVADISRDNFDPTLGPDPAFFGRGRSERFLYRGDFQAHDAVRLVVGAEHEETRFFDGFDNFDRGVSSVWGEILLTPLDNLAITGAVRHDDDEAFGGNTVFGLNAAYTLGTGTTVRASYAEGFKAPTLFQLYAPFLGTPTLQPEEAQSWDVGVEQRLFGGRLAVQATYFNRDTTNQIDFDSGTFTYGNIASTQAKGFEVGVEARFLEGLSVSGAYTHVDAENRSPGFVGNDLARRPNDSLSLSVDYRLPFGLSVGSTVLTVGDSFDNVANTVRLDGYTLASIRAEMPIGERLSIYGRVENLFDEDYTVVSGYGTIGRTAHVGVRVRFD